MSDLISRQAAIDAIDMGLWRVEWDKALATAILKDLPSAEQERKKGKWIHDGYDIPQGCDWIHCSVCGKRGINVPADLTNFCPNCGVDMRGGEE